MGIVLSLLLVAVGAVLRFAVTADASGINLQTAGMVLMIVGAIGVVLSLIFWASWGGFHRESTVVQQAPGTGSPTVVTTTERVDQAGPPQF
jgi:hypothetical protein